MNSSHSLSHPYWSRATIALLYALNKALNHLHRQVIIKFTCICSNFCHHLQAVESCHGSSCLQVDWDFDLILTKILPRASLYCAMGQGTGWRCQNKHEPRPLLALAQGTARQSCCVAGRSSLPRLILPLPLPLPPALSAPGHTRLLSVPLAPSTLLLLGLAHSNAAR